MSTYTIADAVQRFKLDEEEILRLLREMDIKAFGQDVELSEREMQRLNLAVERQRRTSTPGSKGGKKKKKKRNPRRRKRRKARQEADQQEDAQQTREEPRGQKGQAADEEDEDKAESPASTETTPQEDQQETAGDGEGEEGSQPQEPTEAQEAQTAPKEQPSTSDQEASTYDQPTQKDSQPKPVREGMPEQPDRQQQIQEARRRKAELAEKLAREQEEKLRARTRPRAVLGRLEQVLERVKAYQQGEAGEAPEGDNDATAETPSRASPSDAELADEPARPRVEVEEGSTVSEVAELLGLEARDIIQEGITELGLMLTINQRLDRDELELICESFDYEADIGGGVEEEREHIEQVLEHDYPEKPRPPVATVLGHVDHGKTSLLDRIRKTEVAGGEAGGITQHIGAYQVQVDGGELTFLDTPGHEAFTAMRARGAEITDVAVLVVAADDGVMPQTREAISHARAGGVEMVVAINKMDLPGANADQVKQQLLSSEVVVEEFGGDIPCVEVSAETGEGIQELLETIQLVGDVMELEARARGPARGVVIEGEIDPGRGPLATVLIQAGRLSRGDDFICGQFAGRARALIDDQGQRVQHADPGMPVQVMGLGGGARAGDELVVMSSSRAREVGQKRQERGRQQRIQRRQVETEQDLLERIQEAGRTTIPLVLKADTHGSVQALADSLMNLDHEEVGIEILHQGVGAITESDVLLAQTGGGLILGFHVRPDPGGKKQARDSGVEVRTYNVIYRAVEDIKRLMEGKLDPEIVEEVVGEAEVRETFDITGVGTIGGCYVQDGVIDRNGQARLVRDGRIVYEGDIDSLKRFQEDVTEVREDYECGIHIADFNDIKVGDRIECVHSRKRQRSL